MRKKEVEKQALAARQINQQVIKPDAVRNQLISKPKGLINKPSDQKRYVDAAKVSEYESGYDKSNARIKAQQQQNFAKKPAVKELVSGLEGVGLVSAEIKNEKLRSGLNPLKSPKQGGVGLSLEMNRSPRENEFKNVMSPKIMADKKKAAEVDAASKRDEMEKKKADRERERLAMRQQMQLDIKNKRVISHFNYYRNLSLLLSLEPVQTG